MSKENVVNVYIIKDKSFKKRGLSLEDAQNLYQTSEEAAKIGDGVELSLTLSDGSKETITFFPDEVYDKESVTVPFGVNLPKNQN